jgi:hypothetical protein
VHFVDRWRYFGLVAIDWGTARLPGHCVRDIHLLFISVASGKAKRD